MVEMQSGDNSMRCVLLALAISFFANGCARRSGGDVSLHES